MGGPSASHRVKLGDTKVSTCKYSRIHDSSPATSGPDFCIGPKPVAMMSHVPLAESDAAPTWISLAESKKHGQPSVGVDSKGRIWLTTNIEKLCIGVSSSASAKVNSRQCLWRNSMTSN